MPPGPRKRGFLHLRPQPAATAIGIVSILLVSFLTAFVFGTFSIPKPPPFVPPVDRDLSAIDWTDRYDILLLDVDQDGNLVQNATYDAKINSELVWGNIWSERCWGKITELTTGGFAIAGVHEIDEDARNSADRQLWVKWTDEYYNPVWNRTYGKTSEIHSITEMKNGDLAIGHYNRTFQILVIDDEGEYVGEQSWRFTKCSAFSHCDNGGFILSTEIDKTNDSWIARIDADLSVIWNKTYTGLSPIGSMVDDIAGGFTISKSYEEGGGELVRLDNQGDETSRVFIASSIRGTSLIRCINGEYLVGGHPAPGCFVCVYIDGTILWEKDIDFGSYCSFNGLQKLSSNRFVTWGKWHWFPGCDTGAYLECFDTGGTTLWNRSVLVGIKGHFYVADVISNSDGGITILGLMDPPILPSVLDCFPKSDTNLVEFNVYPLFIGAGMVLAVIVIRSIKRWISD
jgi:hypothetical protein